MGFMNVHSCECKYDELHNTVKEYFQLEAPQPTILKSSEDTAALKILESTAIKKNDHFEVGLLWQNMSVHLPESYNTAYRRMKCLERKFIKEPELRSIIQKEIDNLLYKGYAKKLPKDQINIENHLIWYLPIFIARNPNKPNKIRLVWDAAAKSNGVSLNDFILNGPDFLNPLIDVLLVFRVGKVAICGDIAEMFHRIQIKEPDMHAQRFLWSEAGDQEPEVYVMSAMTFGIKCAPCIAHYIRDKNAEQFTSVYPRAVMAIQKRHYVDDFIDSVATEEEAIQLAEEVTKIHASGGFMIRNWASNSRKVLQKLNSSNANETLSLSQNEKVLGMYWDSTKDVFKYHCRFARVKRNLFEADEVPTKREVLQVLMSVFDPLGFLACYTVSLKVLLQEIWRSGIDWDDCLLESQSPKWFEWVKTLEMIRKVEIPRCYTPGIDEPTEIQLHTFVDAGDLAYAAICYLRIKHKTGVLVSMVAAKAKVAPLKPISIPRLELQAAIIGVRLAKKIQEVQGVPITSCLYWSDSKTVLKWMRMDPRNFQSFVMHRIGEILELSDVSQWNWVPSKKNPADLATKIHHSNFDVWFQGPDFLLQHQQEWPTCNDLGPPDSTEIKKYALHMTKTPLVTNLLNVEYFSNWEKLVKAVATFLFFVDKLKTRITAETMPKNRSFHHMQRAETLLFKQAQASVYADEIWQLSSGLQLTKKSNLICCNVYMDDECVLRTRSRADNLQLKDAIVLPKMHHVTFLIVKSYHERFHHTSHEAIINTIRGKFYISKLRVLYKTVRKSCQICRNNYATPDVPQMAQLPAARLAAFERPFTFTGIDFFGPILVTVGRRKEKRYGVLFTCLTVRAIHLEIAHSLDTSSCVMAIRNFVARRGSPKDIYTDNGTNFQAAEKALREFTIDDAVSTKFTKIRWFFNPPAAPHMGGAWERMVRSVKTVLYAMCPTQNFTEETLRSALLEVEFIVNSRPLTFVSLDSSDDEALTPNHLLLGSANGNKLVCDDGGDLRLRWKQTQLFADRFWQRWVAEYTPCLTRRGKWFHKRPPVKIGDVVVIVDENLRRYNWPKGIIVETIAAKDGQVRRVKVKTQNGFLIRPTSKIAVLDVGKDGGEAEPKVACEGENVAATLA